MRPVGHQMASTLILTGAALCVAACFQEKGNPSRSQSSASGDADKPVVLITGPTLIAFFPKVDQADVDLLISANQYFGFSEFGQEE